MTAAISTNTSELTRSRRAGRLLLVARGKAERLVVCMHVRDAMSLGEVGAILGMTRSRIAEILDSVNTRALRDESKRRREGALKCHGRPLKNVRQPVGGAVSGAVKQG